MIRYAAACVAVIASAFVGGCAHHVTRLDRECPTEPGGWCADARAVARSSWEYAQLSQNAYWEQALESDKPKDALFVLPETVKERFASADDPYGFAYTVFDRFVDERLAEVIVAYRGTEGPKDWWNGNLLGRQGRRGLLIFEQVREGLDQHGYGAVPISVTGHSLGGSIADFVVRQRTQAGAMDADLASYTFNTDPPGRELTAPGADSPHIAVSESGDIVGTLRLLPGGDGWDGYVIDCRPGFDPIGDHYMRFLAECLTRIAASEDPAALESVRRNEMEPPPVVSEN